MKNSVAQRPNLASLWEGYLPARALLMGRRQALSPSGLQPGHTLSVTGQGNLKASLVFIGASPDKQGSEQNGPFSGKAGELLDRMISAITLRREDVYLARIIQSNEQSHPSSPEQHEPEPVPSHRSILIPELDLMGPRVIVTLGEFAAQALLQTQATLAELRGNFYSYRGAKLIPTFDPAYLLENPQDKKEAWTDLKQVASELGIQISPK